MERQNFRERSKEINKQAAQACVELFKEYDITELVVPTCSVESVDLSDDPGIE